MTRGGSLYVGTDCDGLAIGSPFNDFHTWRTIPGPSQMPASPGGDGLPSALVNCLLVSKSGTVYAGTTTGLARSEDGGKSWRFLRGADWEDRVKGLYNGPAPVPTDTHGRRLLEDWVSALAEDNAGQLWVGYRSQDVEVINRGGARLYPVSAVPPFSEYVTCLLARSDGSMLMGKYGGGLAQLDAVTDTANADVAAPAPAKVAEAPPAALPPAPFPTSAPPPTVAQLTVMAQRVSASTTPPAGSEAALYLGADWQTQGDWVGRYGRQYALLCAAQSPLDSDFSCWNLAYQVHGQIGPHHAPGDALRHWVHWAQTDNPKSLYDPVVGHRRQSEWDDRGEAYDRAFDGPNEWIDVTVPAGTYRVSLYFVNKDGHDADNRFRDYTLDVRPYREDVTEAEGLPSLARARVRDFWGGEYQEFAVQGPGRYSIRIGKNGSLNALCSGVFIDKMSGPHNKWDDKPSLWLGTACYDPPQGEPAKASTPTLKAAMALWAALDGASGRTSLTQQPTYRLLAYRAAVASGAPATLLANWRWSLKTWTGQDRQDFGDAMAASYRSLLDLYPQLRVTQR